MSRPEHIGEDGTRTMDRTLSASFFAGGHGLGTAEPLSTAEDIAHPPSDREEGELPFTVPDKDTIFALQDKLKQEQREAFMTKCLQPVHNKTTFAATVHAAVPLGITAHPTWRNPLRKERQTKDQTAAAGATGLVARHQTRESVSQLVDKKREIFLVQIGLDVKADEIAKLQDQALQREAALDKAEKLLDADARQFEDFLRQNAGKLQEAISRADAEARTTQEKATEIKQLGVIVANTRNELARTEEQLEEAKRLQAFLQELTPPERRAGLVRQRDERHAANLATWQAECDAIQKAQQEAHAEKLAAEDAYENARTQQEADRAQAVIRAAAAALKTALAIKQPPVPELEPINEDAAYFEEPAQLLEVLNNFEAQNLMLIQSTQEARAAMEDAHSKQQGSNARLAADCAALQAEVLQLQQAKEEQAMLCHSLKVHDAASASESGVEEADLSAEELQACVSEAYERCGFTKDPSLGMVQMMTAVETRLNDCLAAAAALPPELLEAGEKAREKGRRQAAREAKKQQEAEEYQARLERATLRAAAPAFKKSGKRQMTTSTLQRNRAIKTENQSAKKEAEMELQRYIDRNYP